MEVDVFMNLIKEWWPAGAAILVVASYFIEISKVKINPISFVTKIFNKPIIDLMKKHEEQNRKEFSAIMGELKKTSNQVDVNEAKRLRSEIMSFAVSLRKREPHSEQDYKNIITAHDDYEELIKKTNLKNGVIDEDYAFIVKVYRNCSASGQFENRSCFKKMEESNEPSDIKQ